MCNRSDYIRNTTNQEKVTVSASYY